MAAVSGERFVWEDDLVYVSGSYSHQALSYQTMYRVRASHLLALHFDGVEVVQPDGQQGISWTKAFAPGGAGGVMAQPGRVFSPARSEGTLYFDGGRKEWMFVDKEIHGNFALCRAADIVGPWRCSDVAQLVEDPRLFRYAGKAHPDLLKTDAANAGNTGIVVSYVTNAMDISILFEKEFRSEYLPKFLLIEGI